jgi:hypothetical protein
MHQKINDNNHGYSLGIYQKLALDNMVLKVCNAYEPLEKQYTKFFEDSEDECLPCLESISELIEWGQEFGETVSSAYLASHWDHSYDAARIRTALKRLFKEIEVIEKGPNSP